MKIISLLLFCGLLSFNSLYAQNTGKNVFEVDMKQVRSNATEENSRQFYEIDEAEKAFLDSIGIQYIYKYVETSEINWEERLKNLPKDTIITPQMRYYPPKKTE